MALSWLTALVFLFTAMYTMQNDQDPTTKKAERCLLDDVGATSEKRHRTEKGKIKKLNDPTKKYTKDDYEISELLYKILKLMKGDKKLQLKGNYRLTVENRTVSYVVNLKQRLGS